MRVGCLRVEGVHGRAGTDEKAERNSSLAAAGAVAVMREDRAGNHNIVYSIYVIVIIIIIICILYRL